MKKNLLFFISLFLLFQHSTAQKKYINRKIAQKNYEGYLFMQEEKYDSALILFNEALKEDPEAFFIYQNRALCHLMLKDTAKAIIDYKKNIRLEPQNAESCYALGNIYKSLKDTLNAKNLFLQSVEKSDTSFSQVKLIYMLNYIGRAYSIENKHDSAVAYFNKVKKYKPKDSDTYINSAASYFMLDSVDNFCEDIEKAYVLGGAITCKVLSTYCKGCQHLLVESNRSDTLSNALDSRLLMTTDFMIQDKKTTSLSFNDSIQIDKKVKVYFNQYWQICKPENAYFYREAFWAQHLNFFGGDFTDFYIDGNIYAKGRIMSTKLDGEFTSYYKNGSEKIKGLCNRGIPVGKWEYFLENGILDFTFDFNSNPFNIQFQNKINPNFNINNGNGVFEILLDNWEGLKTIISGEYSDFKRNGVWDYRQGNEVLVHEKYKNGILKNGFITSEIGKIKIFDTAIDKTLLLPPYINQISYLYFDSIDTLPYYSFIRIN